MKRGAHADPGGARQSTRLIFAILATGVSAFSLLQSFVLPVLTQLQDSYDTDQTTVTWVLTAYLLSASVATPLAGRIGDAVGKKRALVCTLLLLAVGSLFAAIAPSIEWLIAARVVQGLGGGVLPLSFGMIRDIFPADRRNHAISVIAALGAVGFGVGVVVAGPLVDVLGHHWLFWIPMAATAAAAVATIVLVPESTELSPGRINPLTPALFATSLVALLLAISQGERLGWGSGTIVALLVGSAVCAVAWVTVEARVRVPFIDLEMMRVRGVWTANVVAFLSGAALFAAYGFLPQLLQTPEDTGYGFGATVTESGRLLVPTALFAFLSGLMTSRLVRRFSARSVIASGCLLNAGSFLLFAITHEEHWQVYVGTTLWGLGQGLVFSSMAAVVTASVPGSQSGVANGMNANIRTIGGSIGTAAMAAILATYSSPGALPEETGYVVSFVLAAVLLVLAAAAALGIPNIPPAVLDEALEFASENAELSMMPVIELSGARRHGRGAPPREHSGTDRRSEM